MPETTRALLQEVLKRLDQNSRDIFKYSLAVSTFMNDQENINKKLLALIDKVDQNEKTIIEIEKTIIKMKSGDTKKTAMLSGFAAVVIFLFQWIINKYF